MDFNEKTQWAWWIPVLTLTISLAVTAFSAFSEIGAMEQRLKTIEEEIRTIRSTRYARKEDLTDAEKRFEKAVEAAEMRLKERIDMRLTQ
jgi:hypothetical protein